MNTSVYSNAAPYPAVQGPNAKLRSADGASKRQASISLNLGYRPPFDWESLLATFRRHQLPDLETVDDLGYERIFHSKKRLGFFRVSHNRSRKHSLRLTITNGDETSTDSIVQGVRRMFDLDADPARITEAMAGEPYLADVWARHPGLRIPRSWDRFETMITTILGQLVSVRFGRALTRELMHSAGRRVRHPRTGEQIFLFPTPEQLLAHELSAVRTSQMRRTAIRGTAELVANRALRLEDSPEPKELRKILLSVPGIGAWTAEYIAMRSFDDDDAFPATDYALKQELKRHPKMNVNRVRPWRAYAAAALWKSFAETKGTSYK
jgi:3-methyladenine DNA glycosylase/8-oxoguanine DNA glycosylase